MTEIWYYIHIVNAGYLPGRYPSLQSAIDAAEQKSRAGDDQNLTIVEISKNGRDRKKTGFFDKWGSPVQGRPVGMPLTI